MITDTFDIFGGTLSDKRGGKSASFFDELGDFEKLVFSMKNVIVSPKAEKAMAEDSELAGRIEKKLLSISASGSKDSLVIVDKRGEVSQYCLKDDSKKTRKTEQEELRETLKARARKKARLDAYFRQLEQVCMKRKLLETDSIRRRKYRASVTAVESAARAFARKYPQKIIDF